MQKIYLHLIEWALARNCKISVWDGEEWQVSRSTKPNKIRDAVKSVEEAQLRFRDCATNEIVGWARVSDYLHPEETVIDYSGVLLNRWDEENKIFE